MTDLHTRTHKAGALSVYSSSVLLLRGFWRRIPITLTRNVTDASGGFRAPRSCSLVERHGLTYLWEGTAAFEERRRTLAPEQYQILPVHTPKDMTHVILFSNDILNGEGDSSDSRLFSVGIIFDPLDPLRRRMMTDAGPGASDAPTGLSAVRRRHHGG
jgi:hypothetical protein